MKKRLLNEQTTRKMMGLAGIGSLSEKFITEAEELEDQFPGEEEEEGGEGPPPEMGDEEVLDEPSPEEADIDLGAEEPDLGEPPADDAGLGDLSGLSDEEKVAVLDAVAAALGLDADIEGEDPMGDPMGDPMEEPMPEDEPVMEDLEAAGVELEEDSDLEEDIVNEITRRVARRLLRESAKRKQ